MGEGSGRRSTDAPARHRGGEAAQGASFAAAMAAEQQHRRLAVGSRQLKTAGRGLVGGLHLGDHAGERSIAEAIFGKRQDLSVVAALGVEDLVRAQADLLEARRIEIETRHGPKDGEARFRGEARRDPGGEQGGAGIVIEARRRGGDLMQSRAIETMIGQALVKLGQSEGQRRPTRGAGMRQACAKRGKLVDPVLIGGGVASGHGNNDSNVPYMFLRVSRFVKPDESLPCRDLGEEVERGSVPLAVEPAFRGVI